VVRPSIRDWPSRVLGGLRGLWRYLNRPVNDQHSIPSTPHSGNGPASALVRDAGRAVSSGVALDEPMAVVGKPHRPSAQPTRPHRPLSYPASSSQPSSTRSDRIPQRTLVAQ